MNFSSRWLQYFLNTLLFASFGVALASSSAAVNVTGKVLDQTGAPLIGATVELSAQGIEKQQVTTGQTGEFQFALSLAGIERVEISARLEGFLKANKVLALREGSLGAIEIVLPVEGSNLTVTVTEKIGYQVLDTRTGTKTPTAIVNIPQSISLIPSEQIRDQAMMSMADVVRYVPGITMAQGEGHRDAPVIRGNATTADFFVNGVRDDVQYYRDLYNLERVEALKGPNAMIFGRGGGGGVLNRVTKEAGFTPYREVIIQGGPFGHKRVAGDIDQPINRWAAFRLNSMFEDSGSFRQFGELRRYGIAPTLTLLPTSTTKVRIGYEFFNDGRLVDRGIPSFQGLPLVVDRTQYFGNPDVSRAKARVNLGNVIVEQQWGAWNVRNQSLFGNYDKFYGNVFPGAVNTARTLVALSAYDDATNRTNFFNQTDVVRGIKTGRIRHTLLVGTEIGRQLTYSLRNTGYFNNTATTINVPLGATVDFTPVTFRQSATDANNRVVTRVGAVYVQDQIELARWVQVVAGARIDHFDQNVLNQRTSARLRRIDNMVSPRVGVVLKPMDSVSVYGNYSVSYLPSSGDQFTSLTATTQTLKPEKFENYEVGAKWDLRRGLSLGAAYYWLDRFNTTAPDPNNPAVIVQTGSQRSKGLEFSLNGKITRNWSVAGGYALQDARITSRTSAALPGQHVAQVPRNSISLWNHYRILPRLSGGLGLIHQSMMFASIDNTVRIPGFTRADAGVFYQLSERLKLQANIENLTNRSYIINAHNNNNLTPGFARTARISLTARF